MIPFDRDLILDTNVVIVLVRGQKLGTWIQNEYQLDQRTLRPLVSAITVGEALALAKKWGWSQPKLKKLEDLLRELVVVDVNKASILNRYAEIWTHLEAAGTPIGENDTWLAATASATNAVLLTTDTDFNRVPPLFLEHVRIDPAHGQ